MALPCPTGLFLLGRRLATDIIDAGRSRIAAGMGFIAEIAIHGTAHGVRIFANSLHAILVAAFRARAAGRAHLLAGIQRPESTHIQRAQVLAGDPEGRMAGVLSRHGVLIDGGHPQLLYRSAAGR